MKYQIRQGVFETNSSSTHSISICSKQDFENWQNGKMLFDPWAEEFYSISDIKVTRGEMKSFYENTIAKTDMGEFFKKFESLKDTELKKIEDMVRSQKLEEIYDTDEQGLTYEQWMDSDLEHYSKHFRTDSGDDIVVFGRYGYDG